MKLMECALKSSKHAPRAVQKYKTRNELHDYNVLLHKKQHLKYVAASVAKLNNKTHHSFNRRYAAMQDLGDLEKMVDLRTTWKDEQTEFTPWLKDHLQLLNKVICMNLVVKKIHGKVGYYEYDLLCQNTDDGSLVVIENQLNEFDHDHLGKALGYKVNLNSRTVIWIAEDFTNEHRRTLDWLNDCAGDDSQFFGIQLEVVQINDSLKAPNFNLIVKPNDWKPSTIIDGDYWDNFIAHLRRHSSNLEVLKWGRDEKNLGFHIGYGENGGQQPDYWISAGKSGGFIAVNLCMKEKRQDWIADNQRGIDKFLQSFKGESYSPKARYAIVGVRKQVRDAISQESEFDWFHKRLEKFEQFFKAGGEINLPSADTIQN